jgi:hypothetical protein
MRLIPLQAVPNQSLSFTLDDNRWQIRIAQAVTSMFMDITINDEVVILGTRIPGDDFIIPYPYIGLRHGNLMLTTQNERMPDWNRFGLTQQLFYWSPEEMEALANG